MSDIGNVADLASERIKRELQKQIHHEIGFLAIVVGVAIGGLIWYFNRRMRANTGG